jgi:hypothetical protein
VYPVEHVVLSDPQDLPCPITDRAERKQYLFHGTTEKFAPSIEKEGLSPHRPPYRKEDLEDLLEVYEDLAFEGSWVTYTALKVRTDTVTQGPPSLGFTRFWRNAVDYAIMARAGTTVMILLNGAQELVALVADAGRRQAYQRALEARLEGYAGEMGDGIRRSLPAGQGRETLSHALAKMQDRRYLDHVLTVARGIVDHYLLLVQKHRPVVYALKVPEGERRSPRWSPLGTREWKLHEALGPEALTWRIDLPADATATFAEDPDHVEERTLRGGTAPESP